MSRIPVAETCLVPVALGTAARTQSCVVTQSWITHVRSQICPLLSLSFSFEITREDPPIGRFAVVQLSEGQRIGKSAEGVVRDVFGRTAVVAVHATKDVYLSRVAFAMFTR